MSGHRPPESANGASGRERRERTPAGFTLLEVLVAVSILTIVMAGTYATVVQTRASIQAAESTVEGSELGHQAVGLLAALLESTYFARSRPELAFTGASRGRGSEAADRLHLVAAAGHLFPLGGPPGDLLECDVELQVQPDGRRLLLLHVGPAGVADPRNPGPAFVLSSELSGLDLSFLTPEGWVEDFEAAAWTGLPSAVRVRVYREGTLAAARIVTLPLGAEHPAHRAEP